MYEYEEILKFDKIIKILKNNFENELEDTIDFKNYKI